MNLSSLFIELKRRRVFQVAAVYGAVAFVIAQVADIAFPALLLPDWALRLVLALLVIGFPIALVLAWAFDVTPDGVVRTDARPAVTADAGPAPSPGRAALKRGLLGTAGVAGVAAVALLAGFFGRPDSRTGDPDRSIAVLPFDNLSAEPENAFFASGIHEEIVMQLSRIADLKVISRSSVLQYTERPRDLRVIGDRLGVGTVLEGSVQRYGDRVRITAQLIDARTDRHIWADRYDRELSDVFAIQTDVALQIAGALRASLTMVERARIQQKPTDNTAAYDLLLRARELWGKGREQHEAAIELLLQAIRLDPGFAAAHALLATAYASRAYTYGHGPAWADSAARVASRAIALAPDLPAAHNALASSFRVQGRLREALASRMRAVELDPNYASAFSAYAVEAAYLGRFDEALLAARKAAALDPTSANYAHEVGVVSWYMGNDAEAEHWLREAIVRDAQLPWPRMMLVYVYLTRGERGAALEALRRFQAVDRSGGLMVAQTAGDAAVFTGDYEEAARHYEAILRTTPDARHQAAPISFRTLLAGVLVRTGQRERALPLIERSIVEAQQLMERGNEHYGLRVELAILNILRGDRDAGYDWLERAVDAGLREHRFVPRMPGIVDLSGEPRFQRLLARIEADVEAQRARMRRDGVW